MRVVAFNLVRHIAESCPGIEVVFSEDFNDDVSVTYRETKVLSFCKYKDHLFLQEWVVIGKEEEFFLQKLVKRKASPLSVVEKSNSQQVMIFRAPFIIVSIRTPNTAAILK